LQIAEQREREQEESQEQQQAQDQEEEASANVSLGKSGNSDMDVMDWRSNPSDAVELSPRSANEDATSGASNADDSSAQAPLQDKATVDLTSIGQNNASAESVPYGDVKDASDLRICLVEEDGQEDQCIDSTTAPDLRGSGASLQTSFWCSPCQSKTSERSGAGRTVCAIWKESGLADLVSL
jgi:hypothetical protein